MRVEKQCPFCKEMIIEDAVKCRYCGEFLTGSVPVRQGQASECNYIVTVLLCFFFGVLGFHRFYAGKIGTGILMILTLGGLGIWTFVDFVFIVCGCFRDKKGLMIKPPVL